jgi:hypothetical protein
MKFSFSRRQGCSCSRLPQNLDNEEDEGLMAFPKGKMKKRHIQLIILSILFMGLAFTMKARAVAKD